MGACIPFGPELILPWRHEIKILIFLLFFTSFVFSCAIRNTTMRKYVMTLFQILFLKSLWRKYSFFVVFYQTWSIYCKIEWSVSYCYLLQSSLFCDDCRFDRWLLSNLFCSQSILLFSYAVIWWYHISSIFVVLGR